MTSDACCVVLDDVEVGLFKKRALESLTAIDVDVELRVTSLALHECNAQDRTAQSWC